MKKGIASVLAFFGALFSNLSGAEPNRMPAAKMVLMVPPEGFRFNAQTAESNAFQHKIIPPGIKSLAISEYLDMVEVLKKNGVDVLTMRQPGKLPDAVFPNNWFSTHLAKNGSTNVYIYPMLTPNRQAEVNVDTLLRVLKRGKVNVNEIIDFRNTQDQVLEGTGSMVLDRGHKIIYAALSDRTNLDLVKKVAKRLGYKICAFNAVDDVGKPIYHTNVMMGLGEDFAIVCLSCIPEKQMRQNVVNTLRKSDMRVIDISLDQVKHMCGNVLSLRNNQDEKLLVMSKQAYEHFTEEQLNTISQYNRIVPVNIDTIELVGGGSARCMMAEIYHT